MPTINLLYKRQYAINDSIKIVIPTVREVLSNEDEYYNLVDILTAMPIDYMVQLDDAGIDFTSINSYEFFLIMFEGIRQHDTSLIFGDLDLNRFNIEQRDDGLVILHDRRNGIVIDRAIHGQIAAVLRRIHHIEQNRRKPANDDAKAYLLKRAREKMRRNKNRSKDSYLESLIISMVNVEQFKYDFGGTLDLSIYQFNESVRQIIKKTAYDQRMHGVYAGTVKFDSLSQEDRNWLSNNK